MSFDLHRNDDGCLSLTELKKIMQVMGNDVWAQKPRRRPPRGKLVQPTLPIHIKLTRK